MDSTSSLFTHRHYFGLDARAFHAGANRLLARTKAGPDATFTVGAMAEDFAIDLTTSLRVLKALLADHLVERCTPTTYQPTPRFHRYARARVTHPLPRTRARTVLGRLCELSTCINADWPRNAFLVDALIVSGDYVKHVDKLESLSVSVVLRPRPRGPSRLLGRNKDGRGSVREIVSALGVVSPYVSLRVTSDKQLLKKPFIVIFQDREGFDLTSSPWRELRALGRRLGRRVRSAVT